MSKDVCKECGKFKVVNYRDKITKEPFCGNCRANMMKEICIGCDKLQIIGSRDNNRKPFCKSCTVKMKKEICTECEKLKIVGYRDNNGKPFCNNCRAKIKKEICTECKKLKPVVHRNNKSPFCGVCTAKMKQGICVKCNKLKPVKYNNNNQPICHTCYILNRMKNDSKFHFIRTMRRRIYNAFKSYSKNGKIKSSKKYGIDFNAIFEHIGPCPGDRKDYHIDHIFPLSAFDFDNPTHVKAAFAPENHQWLKIEDNLIKNDNYNQENFDNYIKKFEEENE